MMLLIAHVSKRTKNSIVRFTLTRSVAFSLRLGFRSGVSVRKNLSVLLKQFFSLDHTDSYSVLLEPAYIRKVIALLRA